MTRQLRSRLVWIVVALCCAVPLASARPQSAPAQLGLAQPMPVDPQITVGKFANGLRYYVRANKKPEKRAELRLVVKAGSILEDDDQQGLAHFVEHMAFNGTTHFPKNQVVLFMESLGMRFGNDLNAYTSFDETVYMLQVPTDKPETMDKALLVLEDWAHNVSFEATEIEKERGVVMEEWRLRRGAGARLQDKLLPVLLKGSRYADRVPIGQTEIIQHANPDRLKKFYADWYRPDLMAVVAVGDFDKPAVEALIKTHFASLPAAPSPRARPAYGVPDHAGTVYAINNDKEMTATTVEVDNLLPARPEGSVGEYRQKIVDSLFTGMLSARLSELGQKADPPFLFAGAGRGPFITPSKDEASLFAQVKDDGVERGLDALLSEAERVTKFGFTASELERQKQNMLRTYERLVAEKENRLSNSRADEYIRNFLTNESLPTIDDEFALHQRFLSEIPIAEVNRMTKEWYTERNRLVIVNAPEKAGLALPTERQLSAVITAVAGKDLPPYVDSVATAPLLDAMPSPGPVVEVRTKDAIGVTEWVLANGARVVLKPTTFRADEILFRATSPGGTSLANDADFRAAESAAQIVASGGVGKLSALDLRKVMTGKVANVSPYIGETDQGLNGSSSKKDLETMFQLIYLRFTQPRADPTVFGVLTGQMKAALANQSASPDYLFAEALQSAMYGNHPRRQVPTAAIVDQWNLDKAMAFYKERFADASSFTFVFVGSFDPAEMKPLVERYIGGLPSTHRNAGWKDVGVRVADGVNERRVEKGIEPKSQTAIIFSGPFEYDQTHRVAIRAMAEILGTRLLQAIREDLGGTYSISASQNYDKIPKPEYTVSIRFGSDPQRTDDLVKRVFQEIESFKTSGPTEKEVADEREALLRGFETNVKVNNYLLNQMAFKYEYGEDVAGVWDVPDYYRKIDAAMVQLAARTYLSTERYVKVVLMPEKK